MAYAIKTVIAEIGYRGLMRGWAPNMQRVALVDPAGGGGGGYVYRLGALLSLFPPRFCTSLAVT